MANSGSFYQGSLINIQNGIQGAKAAEDIQTVLLLISEAMEDDIPVEEEEEDTPHWAQFRQ